MSQRCPVCKSKLWTDPLFTPSKLKCPRCGTDFRTTVSWVYLRVFLLLAVSFVLLMIIFLSETYFWILIFLVGFIGLLWFLPIFIDLERISGELTTPEGPVDTNQLRLSLKDNSWNKEEKLSEKQKLRKFVYFSISLIFLLLLIFSLAKKYLG